MDALIYKLSDQLPLWLEGREIHESELFSLKAYYYCYGRRNGSGVRFRQLVVEPIKNELQRKYSLDLPPNISERRELWRRVLDHQLARLNSVENYTGGKRKGNERSKPTQGVLPLR